LKSIADIQTLAELAFKCCSRTRFDQSRSNMADGSRTAAHRNSH